MDTQDQRNSGVEIHAVHHCHKCGWPFPNPHPSAKLRRAHKRICGTIEGYKVIDSGEHTHLGVSDDERGSDEDRRTPSPKIAKGSAGEFNSGGVGARSYRSEDEVFSDAVTEFSESGLSPAIEERSKGGRVSDKNEENTLEVDPGTREQFKVDATAGIQLADSPTDGNQMNNSEFLQTETKLLGNIMPIEDTMPGCDSDSVVVSSNNRTEELAVELSSVNGSAGDVSDIKYETLRDFPKEDGKENVCDHGMQSSTNSLDQGTDVKGNEESNVEKTSSDTAVTPSETAGDDSEVACKFQEKDLKTADSISVDQIAEPKEQENNESGHMMSSHALSSEVKSCDHVEVLLNTPQIESYSAQDRDVGSHSDSMDASYTKGDGNENFHVLSVVDAIPAADQPEILIEDFKDHKAWKPNLPVVLDSGEVIESAVVDNKDTVYEEKHSSFLPVESGESTHTSSLELHALDGNLKQEDEGTRVLVPEVPVEKEADTAELKVSNEDLRSNGIEALPETVRMGEVQTDSPIDGHKSRDFLADSSEDILLESTTMGFPVAVSAISADNEASQENYFSGGNNTSSRDKDKNEVCYMDGKESMEVVKEELSANIETSAVSVDNLSVSNADQTVNLLGAGNGGDHEKAGTEFSDLVGSESKDVAVQEKPEMNSKENIDSACSLPEFKETVAGAMDDEVMKNLQEAETITHAVSDSSEVGLDSSHLGIAAPTNPGLLNQRDEDSQEAMKEPNLHSTNDRLEEIVDAACKGPESSHDGGVEISQKISEIPPEPIPIEPDFRVKSSATADESHFRDICSSGTNMEDLQEEGHENLTKQQIEVAAVDVAVDSSSQTDSLEGNWGSASVLSTQSDAVVAIDAEALPPSDSKAPAQSDKLSLQKPQSTSEGHHSNKSDSFEAPSFMTLVESSQNVDQNAAAASDIQTAQGTQQPLQAGWFPSISNVVNESQGRKKNEEIISKVTNWSAGKQHTPLKSLLGEATLEAKQKSLSPKQTSTGTKNDENTTVNSLLGPEAPSVPVAKGELGKEWNSPARYPTDNKKEKRKVKGRPYWVPFVCCSSVN